MDSHFLMRRIHSLTGVVPVGLFLVYHLYLIVTQGLESILFKVPLFEFEVLSVSIEPVPSLNCQ